MFKTLKFYLNPFDGRFEGLRNGDWRLNVLRDLTAGLIVAMVAIPLNMGFAMASGLRPEQGIISGVVAGLFGALLGGSKYQIYGPTAAFIPVIAAITLNHDFNYLIVCAMIAAGIILLLSITGMGRIVRLVPHSIVVGFTIGIAVTIALSQVGEVFGLARPLGPKLTDKVDVVFGDFGQTKIAAFLLAIGTLIFIKSLLKISLFIPAPLMALAISVLLCATVLQPEGLALVSTKFGEIPARAWEITLPNFAAIPREMIPGLLYNAIAIVFVAAIESLLCAHMADRLANNRGRPYHPNKELWGQSWVMFLAPLLNGFPNTGALARTATNIRLGAVSPLAGMCNAIFTMLIAFYLAHFLGMVPMACIGGILLYVAMNMVKPAEIREVVRAGRGHVALMLFTAAAVIATDFLTGVLAGLAVYGVWKAVQKAMSKSGPLVLSPAEQRRVRAGGAPALVPAALILRGDEHGGTGQAIAAHGPAGGHAAGAGQAGGHAGAKTGTVVVKPPPAAANGLRARVGNVSTPIRRLPTGYAEAPQRRKWLSHLRQRALAAPSAFVDRKASVIGRVVMGDHVMVAAGSSIRADEGSPFFIGSDSNIQDGVVMHALQDRYVEVEGERWAIYVGKNVSMAHDALVHGPCYIGDHSFIGFKAVVHDAVVGSHCFVGIGSVVVGVEVPDGRFVPHGTIVDTAEKAAALPPASEAHHHFNEDVVEVNRGLAAAYRAQNGMRRPALRLRPAGRRGPEERWDVPALDVSTDRF